MGGMGRGGILGYISATINTMKKRKKEYNVREMNHMIKKKSIHMQPQIFFPGGCPKGRQREANTITTNFSC